MSRPTDPRGLFSLVYFFDCLLHVGGPNIHALVALQDETDETGKLRRNFAATTFPVCHSFRGAAAVPEIPNFRLNFTRLSTCFSKKKEKAEKQPAAGTRGSEGGEETVGSENSSSGSTRLLEQPKKKQKKVEKTLESTDLTPKKKTPRCVPLPLSRSHGARASPHPLPRPSHFKQSRQSQGSPTDGRLPFSFFFFSRVFEEG